MEGAGQKTRDPSPLFLGPVEQLACIAPAWCALSYGQLLGPVSGPIPEHEDPAKWAELQQDLKQLLTWVAAKVSRREAVRTEVREAPKQQHLYQPLTPRLHSHKVHSLVAESPPSAFDHHLACIHVVCQEPQTLTVDDAK